MGALFHVDPINLIVVVAGIIVVWTQLRSASKWHTQWILTHDKECDEQRKENTKILTALRVNAEKLSTIAESNTNRIDRLEHQRDADHQMATRHS